MVGLIGSATGERSETAKPRPARSPRRESNPTGSKAEGQPPWHAAVTDRLEESPTLASGALQYRTVGELPALRASSNWESPSIHSACSTRSEPVIQLFQPSASTLAPARPRSEDDCHLSRLRWSASNLNLLSCDRHCSDSTRLDCAVRDSTLCTRFLYLTTIHYQRSPLVTRPTRCTRSTSVPSLPSSSLRHNCESSTRRVSSISPSPLPPPSTRPLLRSARAVGSPCASIWYSNRPVEPDRASPSLPLIVAHSYAVAPVLCRRSRIRPQESLVTLIALNLCT